MLPGILSRSWLCIRIWMRVSERVKEPWKNKGDTLKLTLVTWAVTGYQGNAKLFEKENKAVRSNTSHSGLTTFLMDFAFV